MNRQILLLIVVFLTLWTFLPIAPNAFTQISSCTQLLGLPSGFDCEIVVDTDQGLVLPFLLDFDTQGNLYISNNSTFAAVTKVAPDGSITQSSALPDPDGVAVDSQDKIFVAGDGRITQINSFTGGSDVVFATGFFNLDAIAIDSQDDMVVLDGEFFVKKIFRQTGVIQLLHTVTGSGGTGDVAFNSNDDLFIAGNTPGQLIKIDPTGNVDIVIPPTPSLDPGFGALEFGPGGPFGDDLFIILALGASNTIETVSSSGQLTTFASPTVTVRGLAFNPTGDLFVSEFSTPGRIFRVFAAITEVGIDIKPGSDPNSWGCMDINDNVPVAILSTDGFDATAVDADSVRFGKDGSEAAEVHKKKGKAKRHVEDVNKDGLLDMVFHFRFGDTGFSCVDIPPGQKSETLTGKLTGTANGKRIGGEDSLRLVTGL